MSTQPNGQSEAAKPVAKRMVVDPEIQTMAQIDQLLAGLTDDDARDRVISWVVSRFTRGKEIPIPEVKL